MSNKNTPVLDSEKRKINLGSGPQELEGYINLDIKHGTGEKAYPLKYHDAQFDEIRASHLLEHFGYEETAAVLADWVSKLKPGGILKIAVPDFDRICFFDNHNRTQKGGVELVEPYLLGGHTDENDHHKAIFTKEKLEDLLFAAGLTNVCRWESDADDCSSLKVSLNLMGTKPLEGVDVTTFEDKEPKIIPFESEKAEISEQPTAEHIQAEKQRLDVLAVTDKPIRFQAVMSMPRLAFTENMFCAINAFQPLGINVERATGAFWEQGLTRMMEKFANDGFDYLITIDYDTYYTIEQVQRLCQLAIDNPEVDCIVSLQSKREEDVMLMGWKTPGGMDAADFMKEEIAKKELVDITTGHFGLTIIKCDALKTIGKPWFNSIPGPDDSWNDGRVDADIYFWHNMKKCGKRVCLAPKIQIGHLQQMVTFPGTLENGLHPEHYYMGDINANGLPKHCRINDQ